jgi:hypothetical protein
VNASAYPNKTPPLTRPLATRVLMQNMIRDSMLRTTLRATPHWTPILVRVLAMCQPRHLILPAGAKLVQVPRVYLLRPSFSRSPDSASGAEESGMFLDLI